MQLKIVSWNIWCGKNLSQVIEFLRTANADLIGLQEVVQDMDGSNNSAEIIAKELGYEYFFARTCTLAPSQILPEIQKPVEWGNAILSKFPFEETKAHILSDTNIRIAVQADIKAGDKTIHFFSTHLIHTHQQASEIQELQAKNLVKIIPVQDSVVVGDFNALPESNAIQIIHQTLKSADQALNQSTWSMDPNGCLVCNPHELIAKLDYIFTSQNIKTIFFETGKSHASDHVPIIGTIEV